MRLNISQGARKKFVCQARKKIPPGFVLAQNLFQIQKRFIGVRFWCAPVACCLILFPMWKQNKAHRVYNKNILCVGMFTENFYFSVTKSEAVVPNHLAIVTILLTGVFSVIWLI